ncbi:dihydropteroate synthase [Kaarinaea lacus]
MATALNCGDKVLDLSAPRIMGILNVTPDSFSDGGLFVSANEKPSEVYVEKAFKHADYMASHGAAIVDVGGESTRPGAEAVTVDEERRRVLPIVQRLKSSLSNCLISVDTSKPEIMQDAIDAGAHIINDVNALRGSDALETVANSNLAVCLMHMQGQPRTMQKHPHYDNVVSEVMDFLHERINRCEEAGISRDRIIIDPGFGFGKTLQHNLQLFKNLPTFKSLGTALMIGVSRKSMIGAMLDKEVTDRVSGSVGLAALAAWLGADIIRVHDVPETVDAVNVINAVRSV